MASANQRLRERRDLMLMTQEELADLVGVSEVTVRRWESGWGRQPQPLHLRRLCEVLDATPAELGFVADELTAPSALKALGIEADDVPDLQEIQAAVLRLRRSYSTTPPAELRRRVDERLRQTRRLLNGRGRPSWRRDLLEAASWLALLRATVLADLGQFEAAQTALYCARELAREIGHREIEAWTWETAAWMAATDSRQYEARELAGMGMEVASFRSHGLVAATLQRARINGALGDERATVRDLLAGERALSAVGEVTYIDNHYLIDPSKAAFFASGAMAALRRPAETIEHAAEVVRRSEDPSTRNYWPMRVANARLEWAMALADLGDEDEAYAMARLALDRQWFRPDTERRTRMLLRRLRDPRLRADLSGELEERIRTSLPSGL
jgi:transcriptional regulator with XRE-family HTH domain